MCKKINILGTEYIIIFDSPEMDMPEDADGCMDHSTKTIRIAKFVRKRESVQDLDFYRNRVLRHEIIHAFLYESGNWDNSSTSEAWGTDETITDWFAIQSPKIYKVFEEMGCL